MADRAIELLTNAIIKPFNVPSGKAVTKFNAVKFSGADTDIEDAAAATDNVIGIAQDVGAALATGIRVAIFGHGISKILVGTGGATRGAFAKWVTPSGCTDMTVGGGTGKIVCWGQYLQTGSAADLVGLNLGMAAPTVGS